jgi:predicted glycoside hydrolase/deacetylase ChbG (UPF0249 family)
MLPQTNKKRLIISADDFGKSELANKNIRELIRLGKLDRVSVMANGNFNAEEIDEIRKSGILLDIHLDLANVPRKEKKLKKGVLGRGILFLLKHLGSREYKRERIKIRWTEQIEKFHEIFGRYPDGINSHQHVHLFGRYFLMALELTKEYKIPYLRFAKKGLLGSRTNIRRIVSFLWKRDGRKFKGNYLDGPDYFVSLDWIADVKKFTRYFPDGKTELACHPEREGEFEIIKKYF